LKLAFHIPSMRPGCVLLAAALGADPAASRAFPAESWIIDGPEALQLQVFETTPEQLEILVRRVSARYSKRR
jgi:hypothetical protein